MKIQKAKPEIPITDIPLSSVGCGQVFRFSNYTFEEALAANAFYMKLDSPEADKTRCKIANIADGKCLIRDESHRVIIHETILNIV